MNAEKRVLSSQQQEELLATLKSRFEKNRNRHQDVAWTALQAKLEANPGKLWSLQAMEQTGGEPDVVGHDIQSDEYLFFDCSAESPKGRRSVCYDHQSLASRKENKPENSARNMATDMGVDLLDEEQYRALQQLGPFDTKTSSWLKTPDAIRNLGGAIFADYRYAHVFVYHNGAESYYSNRGFRCSLRI